MAALFDVVAAAPAEEVEDGPEGEVVVGATEVHVSAVRFGGVFTVQILVCLTSGLGDVELLGLGQLGGNSRVGEELDGVLVAGRSHEVGEGELAVRRVDGVLEGKLSRRAGVVVHKDDIEARGIRRYRGPLDGVGLGEVPLRTHGWLRDGDR